MGRPWLHPKRKPYRYVIQQVFFLALKPLSHFTDHDLIAGTEANNKYSVDVFAFAPRQGITLSKGRNRDHQSVEIKFNGFATTKQQHMLPCESIVRMQSSS
jgi:hypothetical protein